MNTQTKVRKVVIPAAGFGTRFLPATKAMPKEMLPVVDKPIIQYVVEEAVAAGITDVIIVTGWHKRSIEDHFDEPFELAARLREAGKDHELAEVRRIAGLANFIYLRQKGPMGNGTPVLNARHVVGDEPFAVLWADQFTHADPPRLAQCIETFNRHQAPVLSAVRLARPEDAARYGMFDVGPSPESNVFELRGFVEKPAPADAPSDLLADGCYVLQPDIFPDLAAVGPGKGGEVWLADAIARQLERGKQMYVRATADARYYDTGNKLEYIKANIDFALERPDLGPELRAYLKNKLVETSRKGEGERRV